jgi:hypothetical protein
MVTAMTANRRDFPEAVCWPRCFGRARQETPDERTLKNRLPLLQLRVCFKARSSPSYCVRFSRLFVRSSMIWRYRFVRCVLMCISPVALHTQRARSVWSLRVTYEFAVGLLRLSRAELYSQGDTRDPAYPAPVVPDLFRPVRPRDCRLRSTSIPLHQPGRMPLLRWQRRGVWAALSTALEVRLWERSVSPREAPLSPGRNSRLTQGLLGGLGER